MLGSNAGTSAERPTPESSDYLLAARLNHNREEARKTINPPGRFDLSVQRHSGCTQ